MDALQPSAVTSQGTSRVACPLRNSYCTNEQHTASILQPAPTNPPKHMNNAWRYLLTPYQPNHLPVVSCVQQQQSPRKAHQLPRVPAAWLASQAAYQENDTLPCRGLYPLKKMYL